MTTWFKSIFHPSAKGYLSAWAALLIMAVYCVFFVNAKRWRDDGIIQQDVRIYYEYLPALFTHGDLSFSFLQNDSVADRHQYWLVTQPETGKAVPKYTLGLALVYAPVYLIHHGIARVLGHPIADFSTADGFGIAVSTLLFLGIGLLAARRLWLHWFSDTACAIALLTVFLGTNLLHYTVLSPGYGHVFSFALVALFANEALQWGKTNGSLRAAKMGFLFGLIVLIRPSNAVIGLFVLLVLPNIPNAQGIWQFWFSRWKPLLIAAIFALLAISPQLVVWKQITDSWVVYSYSTERFFFLQPQLLKVWFSFRNGWFTYAPVLLLIFPGFYFLFKLNRPLFWSTVPFFLINSLVIASWWCWWYGGSFGSRPHMDALAISALPLVAFWQGLQRPYLRMAAGLITVGLIALIGFQFKQSTRGIFHYDGMTWPAYQATFLKSIHPQNYPVLIEHPDYAGASKGREYPIPTDTLLLEGTFTLGANTEFALTHNLDLETLYLAGYTRLFNTIQYKVTGNTLSDVFLVATIEDANGETLKYQRWNLYNPQDEWFVYHFRKFEFNWEYDDLKSPKRLKIYLWNPNKQQITVRNLRVSDR